MKLEFSKRAEREARRIHARWQNEADHPDTFAAELVETLEHMITVASPGTPCPTTKRPGLRRMLLPKSECHLYFDIDRRRQTIRVLSVWSGLRRRPPSV